MRGKIPNPIEWPPYLMALSILKLEKIYKTTFLGKCLNKKCCFINFSQILKLWDAIKGVHKYKTLDINISASRQNIKNLISIFGAIHVRIMHAKLFSGLWLYWCGRRIRWQTDTHGTSSILKQIPIQNFYSPASLRSGWIIHVTELFVRFSPDPSTFCYSGQKGFDIEIKQ